MAPLCSAFPLPPASSLEDAPNGIHSALAAGMPVLALPTTYPVAELTQATALLPNLAALRSDDCGRLHSPELVN